MELSYISVCIPTPLFGTVHITSWPTLGTTLVVIRLVRIGNPVTFDVQRHLVSTLRSCWARCHAVIVVLTTSVARHRWLLTLHFRWHVDNLVARTEPVEYLARSGFGHVQVLATESRGYQVDTSCFDHSPVVPKSRQGWAWQGYLDQFDVLVIQQPNCVISTNSSVLILCHTSHSDS